MAEPLGQEQPMEDLPSGEAVLNYGDPSQEATAPLAHTLNEVLTFYLFKYLHVWFFGGCLLYFVVRPRLMAWINDRNDRNPVGGRPAPQSQQSREESMRAARERQLNAAREASGRDAEARAEREREKHEEEQRKRNEREGKYDENFPGAGRTPSGEVKLKKKDEDGENPKKLPKLPGGNQQAYEPFPGARYDGGGGGRYKPTGFSRPSKGG